MTPDINAILRARPRNCAYGAPMGDIDEIPDDLDTLYLQRVRFVDGDYAPDGTYWGSGTPLWAAFKPDLSVLVYVRAHNRAAAAQAVRDAYPYLDLNFYKEP